MCQRTLASSGVLGNDDDNDDYIINELVNKLMICDREKICE